MRPEGIFKYPYNGATIECRYGDKHTEMFSPREYVVRTSEGEVVYCKDLREARRFVDYRNECNRRWEERYGV